MALCFDHQFVTGLPGDPEQGPRSRAVAAAWSAVMPTPAAAPKLLAYSPQVSQLLGLNAEDMGHPHFAEVFGGNGLFPGMRPFAANYGGHQFGHWAGQLGDGRAITLGEAIGVDGGHYELQLKGAGRTPYSRGADGRAVLRSSIREFLCSEAMHHLGVPTTRALSLVATGESVVRDMFYDGHPRAEPGAIVCRLAPSFLRFGSFELPSARGDIALLRRLADFSIARDFPALDGQAEAKYAAWFGQICTRTAVLMAHWMRVGFVHGVMNTDNMSILGLTLDYGPYGWIENYDPEWTPNTTDARERRYRFGTQSQVAYWNLGCLAQALAPLFGDILPLQEGLEQYRRTYTACERDHIATKLGLAECRQDDPALMEALHALMRDAEMDMTLTFLCLNQVAAGRVDAEVDVQEAGADIFAEAFYADHKRQAYAQRLEDWLGRYAARLRQDPLPASARAERMRLANPRYVLRHYLVQQAIDQAEEGDTGGIAHLLEVMRRPYTLQPGREAYAARRPDWARNRIGYAMLSCSS